MIDWLTYQRAALDYSRYRPIYKKYTFVPEVDVEEQALPTDALGIIRVIGYQGITPEEYTGLEISNTTPYWAQFGGLLHFWPAPAPALPIVEVDPDAEIDPDAPDPEPLPIVLFYWAAHQKNEDPEEYDFPTIPANDLQYVDDLEQALTLDGAADDISQGPVVYGVGQTQMNRTAGIADLRQRAGALRLRVEQALGEPYGLFA